MTFGLFDLSSPLADDDDPEDGIAAIKTGDDNNWKEGKTGDDSNGNERNTIANAP